MSSGGGSEPSSQRLDNFVIPDIVQYNEVGEPDVEFSKSFY